MAVRALGQCHDFDQRSLLEPLVSPPVQPTPDATALLEEAARALEQLGAADSENRLLAILVTTTPKPPVIANIATFPR
jgi:hypothetical protein